MTNAVNFTIPSVKAVKDAVKAFEKPEKDYTELPPNLAQNDELVAKFHAQAKEYFTKYQGQASRTDMETYLKDCDAKYRMAQAQDRMFRATSNQKKNTLSHIPSGQYHKTVNIITAGQQSIVFSDDAELPARHDSIDKSADYSADEGKRIAEGENLYLRYVWDKQDWTPIIKSLMHYNVKNSMEAVSLEWERKTKTAPERVPGYYDSEGKPHEFDANDVPDEMFDIDGEPLLDVFGEDGIPRSYAIVEKTRVTKNCPVLVKHRLENLYLDLEIPSKDGTLNNQSCILYRGKPTFDWLLDQQKEGFFLNVETLTASQMYESATEYGSEVERNKDDNADQTRDEGKDGRMEVFKVRMRASIDSSTEGKEKWDDGTIKEIYEAVFVGQFEGELQGKEKENNEGKRVGGVVCTQLRKQPFRHGEFPTYMMHSHEDDRGMLRMGYYTALEANIEEQDVLLNQWVDNKTLSVFAPFIAEKGNVFTRDFQFKQGNQVFWVRRGTGKTALNKMEIPDLTQFFVLEWEKLQKEADEIVQTTDAFKGIAMGSRTTATENLGAREQSMKPAVEDTKRVMNPFFGWLLRGVSDLGRQFADPSELLAVTNGKGELLGEVNPGTFYGETKTHVVGIEKFETDVTAKQVLINFLQAGGYEQAKEFMGKVGALHFWRTLGKFLKIPDILKIFPPARKMVEAENQAWSDVKAIESTPDKAMNDPDQLPKEGEMHDIHIPILTAQKDKWQVLMPTLQEEQKQKAALIISAYDLYILMHEQMQGAEAEQEVQPQAQGQEAQAPGLPGESSGDVISGIEGQQAI